MLSIKESIHRVCPNYKNVPYITTNPNVLETATVPLFEQGAHYDELSATPTFISQPSDGADTGHAAGRSVLIDGLNDVTIAHHNLVDFERSLDGVGLVVHPFKLLKGTALGFDTSTGSVRTSLRVV